MHGPWRARGRSGARPECLEPVEGVDDPVPRHPVLAPGGPTLLDLDHALLGQGVADRHPHRNAEQVGVLELHAGALVAIVQDGGEAGQTMPSASAFCSIAAAAIRAGPMP